jgi:hypothetical protein
MKPRNIAVIALILFAASAWLAWSTAAQDETVDPVAGLRSKMPPKSQETSASQSLLATLERELIAGPKKRIEAFSGKEMDSILSRDGWEAAFAYGYDWAENDPAAMCEWLERRGLIPGPFRWDHSSSFVSTLFEKWAARDADAALAAALRLSRMPARAQGLASSLQVIWRSDPERARRVLAEHGEWLAGAPDTQLSYNGVRHGPADLKFLASLPAGKLRGKLMSLVLANAVDSYSESSHAAATALWESLSAQQKQDLAAGGFLQRMNSLVNFGTPLGGEKSLPPFPDEAELLRGYAESSGNTTAARDYIIGHGDEWAAREPAEAVAWSLAHLKGSDRLDYTAGLFKAAAKADYDRAVAAWQSLPAGVLKARAAGALIAGTQDDRKPEALALLDTLSTHDRGVAEKEAHTRR